MKQIIDFEYMNNFISNVLNDIDNSLEIKIMEYRLDIETITNKKETLKYIKDEKSKLRDLLKEIPNKNTREIDEYRIYLNQKPLNPVLRRKAIKEYFFIKYFESLDELFINLFQIKSYKELREEDFVKSTIELATLLEYNSFLTDQIKQIKKGKQKNSKQEESKPLESDNIKLKWQGNPTELIELIRALFLNKSITGKIGELTNKVTDFFDLEIRAPHKLYEHIKNRIIDSETLFLDQLKSNLCDKINKIKQEELKQEEPKQEEPKQLEFDNIKLKWQGNPTELIELIIALFLYKRIIGEIGELTDKIANFFDIEIKEPYKLYEHIKERIHGNEPLFLDQLKSNLYDEIIKKRSEKSKREKEKK
ncbi:RteC domain-containing protein [Polaribacter sp.]|uniref:RteC domain-containing protein n=1 Tax=Polaribacter sp. TaxID=1920175 RepID=UPI003EF9D7F8